MMPFPKTTVTERKYEKRDKTAVINSPPHRKKLEVKLRKYEQRKQIETLIRHFSWGRIKQ